MNNYSKNLAFQASNEIADLFKPGFFDQGMIEDLAQIIQTKIELAKADEREQLRNRTLHEQQLMDGQASLLRGKTE